MVITSLVKAKAGSVVNTLKQGGLVIAPSDTVYGVLVDATNEKAVKKLIQFKNRPWGKPISVFVADFKMMNLQTYVNNRQQTLLSELLPGPFTVILDSKHKLSELLESERGTLGIRIPDYEFITDIVKKFGKPITATSANLSGRSPHYSLESLLNQLPESKKKLIDLAVEGGRLPRNKPSTIVDLTSEKLRILRRGEILFKSTNTFISNSPSQTNKIAQYFLGKLLKENNSKPIVLIIEGELGVGKTVFVKGLGEYLGLKEIISPTFVVYYEYVLINPPSREAGQLIDTFLHVDLYNVHGAEEFKYLRLEKYLKQGNMLAFEWGEKAGEIMKVLKSKAKIVYVKMKYAGEKSRELTINY